MINCVPYSIPSHEVRKVDPELFYPLAVSQDGEHLVRVVLAVEVNALEGGAVGQQETGMN